SPGAQAKAFEDQGFEWLHVVDLDGAFAGESRNGAAVDAILAATSNPVQLGGGIRTLDHIEAWLLKGLARVILGTIAVRDPALVRQACAEFPGKIAVGIDARSGHVAVEGWAETSDLTVLDMAKRFEDEPDRFEIFTHGGREATGIDAVAFAKQVVALGAGEILLTSMDRDGTKIGYNLPLTKAIADAVHVPVIASGGVGNLDHLVEGVTGGHASAVLAASIFHFGTYTIAEAKAHMAKAGLPMRLV
ncbi:UNVERIFIED_CONTAM: hypothetical protein GTU68_053041, partial [Idotea baltica]|nr:hypothetical protein [Idotea baltica]